MAELTINGITKPIDFKVELNKGKNTLLTSTLKVDRTLWGIKYKSKSVFKNLTDNFIYDDFTLEVKVVLSDND